MCTFHNRVYRPYTPPLSREAFWDLPEACVAALARAAVDVLAAQPQPVVRYKRLAAGEIHGADMDPRHMTRNVLQSVCYTYIFLNMFVIIVVLPISVTSESRCRLPWNA